MVKELYRKPHPKPGPEKNGKLKPGGQWLVGLGIHRKNGGNTHK